MGLYDMMMIKDNHVTAAGGVAAAIARAEQFIQDKVRSGLRVCTVQQQRVAVARFVRGAVCALAMQRVTRDFVSPMARAEFAGHAY